MCRNCETVKEAKSRPTARPQRQWKEKQIFFLPVGIQGTYTALTVTQEVVKMRWTKGKSGGKDPSGKDAANRFTLIWSYPA